ncbi:MAG: WYL domain-containing protein [Lachnospiraceae bacterium]|nr:WYL domain-containing protein [Lachnospiraceae bacterium]
MRANILYIINVLRLYSNDQNPLSIEQITNLINQHYTISPGDKPINKSTVYRALNDYLYSTPYLNDMPDNVPHANYKIHVLIENVAGTSNNEKYMDITDDYTASEQTDKPKSKSAKFYYYYEYNIPTHEITNLISMIETHPYYSSQEVTELSKLLHNISPAYFNSDAAYEAKRFTKDKIRADDTILRYNLQQLYPLVKKHEDVLIEYSYYNEEKRLVPLPNYENLHRVTPLDIIWANGYCYFVDFNPNQENYTNYRVDRITYIQPVEQDTDKNVSDNYPNKISHKTELQYIKHRPGMMSGDPIKVSLLCKKSYSIINRLIDFFGMEITIKPATQDKLAEVFPNMENESDQEWLDVTCNNITPDGAIFCAIQLCTDAVLYYPQELSKEIYSKFSSAADLYKI